MIHQFKCLNLRLEDIFLGLILVCCLVHHVRSHHSWSSHHWIGSHSSWRSWLFGCLILLLFINWIFFEEKIVNLPQSKHDEEVKRHSWDVADIKILKVDSWLGHGSKFLGEWERNFGREESREEGVDPHHGGNGGTHHHEITFHTIHHAGLHVGHIVGNIGWFPGAFLFEVTLIGFTQEAPPGIEGLPG